MASLAWLVYSPCRRVGSCMNDHNISLVRSPRLVLRSVNTHARWIGALLGLNACGAKSLKSVVILLNSEFIYSIITGSLVINEWVQVVHSHSKTYGEPPIRVGRFLAGLAIALAIVLVFQLLILRNPARRTLRKHMAQYV